MEEARRFCLVKLTNSLSPNYQLTPTTPSFPSPSLLLLLLLPLPSSFLLLPTPTQVPVNIRQNEVVSAKFTPKLRLFKKSLLTGLKGEEVIVLNATQQQQQQQTLEMGESVFLEADFEEAGFVAGVETGFRECIASSQPDMSDNRVILVRWN